MLLLETLFEIYDILHNDSLKIASKIEDSFYKNIYVSPSVSKKDFKNLKKYSTVITDMDIFFNEDDSIKIGITGTNKKSTTCYHLMQLLEEEYSTNLVGNIGKPVLDVLNNGKKYSTIDNEKNNNPRLQVDSKEQYAEIMENLNLANPKMMDIAVPANVKGLTLKQL